LLSAQVYSSEPRLTSRKSELTLLNDRRLSFNNALAY